MNTYKSPSPAFWHLYTVAVIIIGTLVGIAYGPKLRVKMFPSTAPPAPTVQVDHR